MLQVFRTPDKFVIIKDDSRIELDNRETAVLAGMLAEDVLDECWEQIATRPILRGFTITGFIIGLLIVSNLTLAWYIL